MFVFNLLNYNVLTSGQPVLWWRAGKMVPTEMLDGRVRSCSRDIFALEDHSNDSLFSCLCLTVMTVQKKKKKKYIYIYISMNFSFVRKSPDTTVNFYTTLCRLSAEPLCASYDIFLLLWQDISWLTIKCHFKRETCLRWFEKLHSVEEELKNVQVFPITPCCFVTMFDASGIIVLMFVTSFYLCDVYHDLQISHVNSNKYR